MADMKIFLESKVLGSMIIAKLVHTPYTFSHISAPPVIYADGTTGLYEQILLSYSEYPDGKRIFDALVDTWAGQSQNRSTIRWGLDPTSYMEHMKTLGKVIVPADRFFYWGEDDPGSTTELCNAIMTFHSDPNMQLMNNFSIKISGYTREASGLYQSLECIHRASIITNRRLKNVP